MERFALKSGMAMLCLLLNTISAVGQGSASCLDFDGTNDHLKILPFGDNAPLAKTYTAHTIEAWVKSDAGEDGTVYSEGWLSSAFRGQFRLYGNGSGKLGLFYQPANSGVLINVVSTTDVFDGSWHHIALVGNGNSTDLYIDGVQDATSFDYVRPLSSEQNCMGIGVQIAFGDGSNIPFAGRFDLPFGGQIDEVRLWSVDRSQTDIRDNLCKKLGGSESNLEYYFRHDGASGTVSTNSVSGVDDDTLQNFALTGSTSNWVTSGVPIGDESVHDYAPVVSSSLNIAGASGDDVTAEVSTLTVAPSSFHVYRVDEAPNDQTPPGMQQSISNHNYFGVAVFGGTGVTYTLTMNYDGHPNIVEEDNLDLASRADNAAASWIEEMASLNTTLNTLTLSGQPEENLY